MKKFAFGMFVLLLGAVVVLGMMMLSSCSQENAEAVGTVTFSETVPRDLCASIGYPDVNSLLWDITATKLSKGSKGGEGTVEGALLTDTFGPFSVGRWEFILVGKDGGDVVYEGTTTAQITEGPNALEVSVNPVGQSGTLVFSGCNFPPDNGNGAEYSGAQILIDGERVFGISRNYCTQGVGGMWVIADQTTALCAGLHDVEVLFVGNEPITAESFKVRIVGGLTTTVTFGTFEGRASFSVNVEQMEAIEE